VRSGHSCTHLSTHRRVCALDEFGRFTNVGGLSVARVCVCAYMVREKDKERDKVGGRPMLAQCQVWPGSCFENMSLKSRYKSISV
jgi:hypothetical protein